MRNRYAGRCRDCNVMVAQGEGFFERNRSTHKWDVRCAPCVAAGRAAAGKSLSLAQQQALKERTSAKVEFRDFDDNDFGRAIREHKEPTP